MSNFIDYMMAEETAEGAQKKLTESVKNKGQGSNIFYRYKTMDYNQTCTVRFLPASSEMMENEVQPKFWLPKKVIRLRFENPEQEGSEVTIAIPTMQMYVGGKPENDIILRQVKALYDEADKLKKAGKDEEHKQMQAKASYHWVRGECIAQCFVIRSPFSENDVPENPIRLVELNKQIMNVITATLHSDDPEVKLDFWPCHGKKGTNFVVKKTKSGDWPKYDSGSTFARQDTPWTSEQYEAVKKFGLWKLEDFLPQRPSESEYRVLAHIVERSIAGVRVWDPDWEAQLETVKVFRTNVSSSEGLATSVMVDNAMSRLSSTPSTSTSEIMSTLTGGRHTTEEENSSVDEPNAEPVAAPSKSGDEVRSILNKIKGKPQTTAAA